MRYYKMSIIILLCISSVAACTRGAKNAPNIEDLVSANPGSFIQIPFLGAGSEENSSKEVIITKVLQNSAADKADIRAKDVVLFVDDIEIQSRTQYRKIIYAKNPSDILSFKIRRNGNILEKKVTLGKIYIKFDEYAILQNIINNKPVRLVILVGEISTTYKADSGWHKGIELQMISDTENTYSQLFRNESNCAVIDRAAVIKIQNEFEFQQSGYVSDEFRLKLGKMFGATHLLIVSFSRFQSSKYGWQDIKYRKLIDVESGKILASFAIKDI
jgi:hypothetical protein